MYLEIHQLYLYQMYLEIHQLHPPPELQVEDVVALRNLADALQSCHSRRQIINMSLSYDRVLL